MKRSVAEHSEGVYDARLKIRRIEREEELSIVSIEVNKQRNGLPNVVSAFFSSPRSIDPELS